MTTTQGNPDDPTTWGDEDILRMSLRWMWKENLIPGAILTQMSFIGTLTADTIDQYTIDDQMCVHDERGHVIDGVIVGFGPLAFRWIDSEDGIAAMRMLRSLVEKPIYPAELP